jgi:dihydrofolate reductase
MEPRFIVYIAASLDGFIARIDGTVDWLDPCQGDEIGHQSESSQPKDYGWAEFFGSVDTMVMGRATYEFVAGTGEWPYEDKRTIVLSSTLRSVDVAPHLEGKFEILSMEPERLVEKLVEDGARRVYVDGGVTIQRFLRAGLIDELIVTRVPVLLGSGIPLFGELNEDVQLRHIETQGFASGLVQSKYAVKPT